ncbi:hypothetical protein EPI10_029132 [Gossypium australe]|uniref:Uncharacterized protein n=1 Tax=Gossypium australe TaxID=47621 RepID=A0A5B6V0K7_9ROSI|nr:hypothetical protein EPI10_029132 [Gossypium australe]
MEINPSPEMGLSFSFAASPPCSPSTGQRNNGTIVKGGAGRRTIGGVTTWSDTPVGFVGGAKKKLLGVSDCVFRLGLVGLN